jgi:hypothetical protein
LNKGELALLSVLATRESATTKQLELLLEERKLGGYLWESLKRLKDRKLIENIMRNRPRKVGNAIVQEPFVDKEMYRITPGGRQVNEESQASTRRPAKQEPKEQAKA